MALRNVPAGWTAFRAFRQRPAPIPDRQHGNHRHGRYSRQGRKERALVRLCAGLLRAGSGDMPVPGLLPTRPLGWAGYRTGRAAACQP